MMPQRRHSPRLWRGLLAVVLAAVLLFPAFGNKAAAGKEGVYINGEAYYTLEKVQLSPGSEKSTLRFTLELVNNSGLPVDINKYGVAVWDAAGNRYGTEYTEKASARVAPGTAKPFKFIAKVPAGTSMEELQIEIFEWNFGASSYSMDPIGRLSVSGTVDAVHSDKPQAVLNLNAIDTSYASDSLVTFELQHSYHALVNGSWALVAHMTAENNGSTSFKLPANLVLNLKDSSGLSFAGSIPYGADTVLLPHQKSPVIMLFPVGELDLNHVLSIEFSKKTAASSNSSSGTSGASMGNTNSSSSGNSASTTAAGASSAASASTAAVSSTVTLLESMTLTEPPVLLRKGEVQQNAANRSGLTAMVESVSLAAHSDGTNAESVFTLKNEGAQAVALPALSAFYQVSGSTLSVAAQDASSHPDFLSPGGSTSYYFNAKLPGGLDGASVQLAVQEAKSATVNVPVFVASLPAVTGADGAPADEAGGVYTTSAGKLKIALKSTYRLMGEGTDVLMSTVQVENLESSSIKLPSMYAFYTDGLSDLDGTVKYVQSSAYVGAGQSVTLYMFANIPYDMEMKEGKLYFGEGVQSNNTWTQKKEWARIGFRTEESGIAKAASGSTWFLDEPGRLATGQVLDEQIYDLNGEKLLAVRIASKNQEIRASAPVPFAGYFTDSEGRVYNASETQDAGRSAKDTWSMSTLWIKLPTGKQEFTGLVFGHKLAPNIFASPRQYGILNQPAKETHINLNQRLDLKLDIAPYHLQFNSISRTVANSNFTLSFKFDRRQDIDLTSGSQANRSLYITVKNRSEDLVGSWEYPLEGTGSLKSGETNELTLKNLGTNTLIDLIIHSKITFYEKFEGGTRLLGTVTATNN